METQPTPRGQTLVWISTATAVAALIAVRFPETLLRSEFWAEDATEFFLGAVSLPAGGLLRPVYGYHFFLERLVALVATSLPVYWSPFIFAWSGLLVAALTLGYVARDGFAWIAPLRWQRVMLALLLALAPGTADVLLNLANLPSVLALLGFFLLAERPAPLGWVRPAVLLLVAASSGHAIMLIPLASYLAWRHRSVGIGLAAAGLAVFAGLNLQGGASASAAAGLFAAQPVELVCRIVAENVFTRLVAQPLAGPWFMGPVLRLSAGAFWALAAASVGAIAALSVRWFARDRDGAVTLWMGAAGAIGLLALVALGRSGNAQLLLRESRTMLPAVRYSFLPAVMATLLWTRWLLPSVGERGLRPAARLTAMFLVAAQLASLAPVRYRRPDLLWPERSALVQWKLDQARAGKMVELNMAELPIHPVGWVPANGQVSAILSN